MTGVGYPKMPRAAVKDSFDEDDLSDIDDEVFIRDGKSGILKINDDSSGVKRPLMAPRRNKYKAQFAEAGGAARLPYRTLFAPTCYVLLGFAVILLVIVLCVVAITKLPVSASLLSSWFKAPSDSSAKSVEKKHVVPCTSVTSKVQWTRTLPKFTSEAPLRSSDVNGDSVEDIIVGFSTGLDKVDTPEYVCTVYFERDPPCLGGVLALDGRTGNTIWIHWTSHAVFAIDCGLDLTGDKIKDCVVSGRGGILHAINGQDGSSVWELSSEDTSVASSYYNVYDARYIADFDDDGIGDVVASHTWLDKLQSEVVFVSGKKGSRIGSMEIPDKEQLFVAPQIIVHPDGETYFVLATSDRQKSGGLYIVPRSSLLKGEFNLRKLYHGAGRGISLPPLLIDVNADGTEDIIAAMFNSTVIALDGLTFKEIWNFTIKNSEIISIPIPGYYNDDKIPDFMVKHQIGSGFPVYYYTTATVLDGKTGKPLLETPIEDTMSAQMSGLSVTVDDFGNDWFLHWSADCLNKEGLKDKYDFLKNPSFDADLCKLRFNSTLVMSLLAFSQHVEPPGLALYRSEDWKNVEFNNSIDPRNVAEVYSSSHSSFGNDKNDVEINKSIDQLKNYEADKAQQLENAANKEYPMDPDTYYSRAKDVNLKIEKAGETFLDKGLGEMSEDQWKNNHWESEKQPSDILTDDNYDTYDDEEKQLVESRQLNEIRFQRSEKGNIRYINNDTNDVENQLDPSMDYTNGQSKQNNYYSSLAFNRSNNVEDNVDYMNIPDIDFVDNIKDAEVLDDRRKRMTKRQRRDFKRYRSRRIANHLANNNAFLRSKKNVNLKKANSRNPFDKLSRNYEMVKFFKMRQKKSVTPQETSRQPERFLGMQRQPPTGILLPSLQNQQKNSVDLVFSTYWLPPSPTPLILLSKDLDCIKEAEEKLGRTPLANEKEDITLNCLKSRGVDYQFYQEATDKENSRISLGQMTLYRMKLQCVCPEDMLPGQTCKDISKQQSWPQHLGASGSGYFEPLPA